MIELLVAPITKLLDKFIPDADTKQHIAHEIATMAEKHAHEEAKMQMEVNKQEAAHKSLFVAGWRPGMGWVCVLGFAMNYLVFPFTDVPPLDVSTMMPVLLGMLGLGGMRTTEKVKKVSRER